MTLALDCLYKRAKGDHFQHFSKNASKWCIKVKRIAQCFKYWESIRKRDMFMTWKNEAKGRKTTVEVNTFGPVVEDVLK